MEQFKRRRAIARLRLLNPDGTPPRGKLPRSGGWITLDGFKGNYTLKTSRGNASFNLKEDMTDTLAISE